MKKRRLKGWLRRPDVARVSEIEREGAAAGCGLGDSGSTGADGICVDETKLPWGGSDGSELEGSLLEVGGAMAGLTPLPGPDVAEDEERSGKD